MSKTYDECCAEVGLNRYEPAPELEMQWVAYESGKIIPCSSMNEAMKHSLYERVTSEESKIAHSKYFKDRDEKETEARKVFLKYLREDYSVLSDSMFNMCYTEAYKRGHAFGFDEVSVMMHDVVSFAIEVRKLDTM